MRGIKKLLELNLRVDVTDFIDDAVEAGVDGLGHGAAGFAGKKINADDKHCSHQQHILHHVLPLAIAHTINIP